MKICKNAVQMMQLIDGDGNVRGCPWLVPQQILGSLLNNTVHELQHGEAMRSIFQQFKDGTGNAMCTNDCVYFANDQVDGMRIDIDDIPEWPESISISFEEACNYHCTCCPASYKHKTAEQIRQMEADYDIIEERLREALPHVKDLSANGYAELCMSSRAIRLLNEWRPLADPSEVTVGLESNGSLFNEKFWRRIENVARFHVGVCITVMSFDERTYQYLSGTTLPIENLIENLMFIKSLRQQGQINYFRTCMVMQELNFREMPSFARRCLEEFGVDEVNFRPYLPSPSIRPEWNWFTDVRNPSHPYYKMYKDIRNEPIMRDERISFWTGSHDSCQGDFDSVMRKAAETERNAAKRRAVIERMGAAQDLTDGIERVMRDKGCSEFSIYGVGSIGKRLIEILDGRIKIAAAYDKVDHARFCGVTAKLPEALKDAGRGVLLVVTPTYAFECVKNDLAALNFQGEIISIEELL